MGLFSSKPKHNSQTPEEAANNNDETFEYRTRNGHVYRDFPFLMKERLYKSIAASSFDDAFEMYAPEYMKLIREMNDNINLIVKQNIQLQNRVNELESRLNSVQNVR